MPNTKPNAMSSLATWLCYLEHLHSQTIDLGLERVSQVAERLQLKRPAPYVITVAGTNGKGTTCRTLEMILLAAGYQVGVYSSPHLLHYTERVRINNQHLAEAQHVAALAQIENARAETSLSYFEFSTLSALYLFKQAQLDVVILEVGLGGRLDATNLVDADVAVITSIALDHTDWLGDNRESIGYEKAGIMRSGCPAIVGEPEMPQSIADYASQIGAKLYACAPNPAATWSYQRQADSWQFSAEHLQLNDLPLPTVPLANAATALATLSYADLNVTETQIIAGLQRAQLPGRMQVVQQSPLVILDVAHNPHAANYLNQQLQPLRQAQTRLHIVLGMLHDKDIASTIANLHADFWYCAPLDGPRGATAQELLAHLPADSAQVQAFASVEEAFAQALQQAEPEDIIVVCGSFHTVAAVLSELENE